MAGTTGLEPAASAVTGQRSNQLNYVPLLLELCCRKLRRTSVHALSLNFNRENSNLYRYGEPVAHDPHSTTGEFVVRSAQLMA